MIAIHQPNYIPYMGYFYKVWKADKFVFLDDCQFSSSEWHNFNRILTAGGEKRLKVPVKYNFGDTIKAVRIDYSRDWRRQHLEALREAYRHAEHYSEVMRWFEWILDREYDSIASMNIAIIHTLCQRFGFGTQFFKSSDLKIDSKKQQRLIDICESMRDCKYLSGTGAKEYIEPAAFEAAGIELIYTDYQPIAYRQQYGTAFTPSMSILDYLFNCGFIWPYQAGGVSE